jgi:hypothetical protein
MPNARRSGFVGGLAGVLAGLVIAGALPALAGNGDEMIVGQKNNGTRATKLVSKGGLHLNVGKPGNPALTINVVAPTPPLVVNSDGMVENLNSDMVDNFDANGLIRATFASTSDAGDANGDAVSASITAPSDGYLIVGGGVDVYGVTTDYFTCALQLDDNDIEGSVRSVVVEDQGDVHTANSEEDCDITAGTAVTAGVHTVSLSVTNRETNSLYQASVWAIFIPFDGTGAKVDLGP